MKLKLSVMEATRLADECERLFRRAALAWEHSLTNEGMERGKKLQGKYQSEAEAMLKPLGITCDYPGLYPSFKTPGGFTEYTCLAAISRALSEPRELKRGRNLR